jgi:hypothetical protein
MVTLAVLRRPTASRALLVGLAIVVAGAGVGVIALPASGPSAQVEERRLIDNDKVMVVELVFPPGFRGGGARGAGG